MESILAGQQDTILNSLEFNLPISVNYITDRKSVSFYPSGSNEYSPEGVKVLKFNISGSGWLDPQTLRVRYRLNNKDNVNN